MQSCCHLSRQFSTGQQQEKIDDDNYQNPVDRLSDRQPVNRGNAQCLEWMKCANFSIRGPLATSGIAGPPQNNDRRSSASPIIASSHATVTPGRPSIQRAVAIWWSLRCSPRLALRGMMRIGRRWRKAVSNDPMPACETMTCAICIKFSA